MMKHEFDSMVGITTSDECYERIEYVYMNSNDFNTKQEIADFYKQHDMNGIEKIYKQILEQKKERHFVIQIYSANHSFIFECTGMYEALEAITDAATTFNFVVNADEVMCLLVEMKHGKKLSHQNHKWGISLKDGEV